MSQLNMSVFAIPNGDTPILQEWEIDPLSPNSLDQYEKAMVAYWTSREMKTRNISYEAAISFSEPDQFHLIAQGVNEAMQKIAEGENLRKRALSSLAFKAFKASLHVHDKEEPDTFEELLWFKLGHVKSQGAISEIKCTLELLAVLEDQGEKEFVEQVFKDHKTYAKFAKAIPAIRPKLSAVIAQERLLDDKQHAFDRILRNAKSVEEREQLVVQQSLGAGQRDETMNELVDDLKKVVTQAVELSKNPNVRADDICSLLNPKSIQDNDLKLRVDKLILKNGTSYIISVAKGHEQVIEQALSDLCDFRITDIQQALERFQPYLQK